MSDLTICPACTTEFSPDVFRDCPTCARRQGAPNEDSDRAAEIDQLGRDLVWGTLEEALNAAQYPEIPSWALRRARRERREPELLAAIADLEAFLQSPSPEERGTVADRIAQRRVARAALRDKFVSDAMDRIRRSHAQGRIPALHTIVLLGSNYSVDGRPAGEVPRVAQLSGFGWDGWEIIATFPRTTGHSLTNTTAGSWQYGGGLGGMVDGVYFVMRFPVTAGMVAEDPESLERMLGAIYERDSAEAEPAAFDLSMESGTVNAPAAPPSGRRSQSTTFWSIGMSGDWGGFDF